MAHVCCTGCGRFVCRTCAAGLPWDDPKVYACFRCSGQRNPEASPRPSGHFWNHPALAFSVAPQVAILDSGASHSIVGHDTLLTIIEVVKETSRGRLQVTHWKPPAPISFKGIGGSTSGAAGCVIPLQVGDTIYNVQCYVVPNDTPLLISCNALFLLKMVIDFSENRA